jgi:hypothetical protein
MPVDTTSKAARRQIADEFKERKVRRGIFAVRCSGTDDVWVGSSPNLDAARNSLWFQLRGGLHRNSSLQGAWKQYGEQTFALDVLEQFEEDTSTLLLNDLYTRKKKEWVQSLSGQML